jgi:hypothetical protein
MRTRQRHEAEEDGLPASTWADIAGSRVVSVNRREKNSCVERQLDRLKVQDLEMKSAVNDGDCSSRDGRTMHRIPDLLQRPSTVLHPSISSGLCLAGRVRSVDLSSSRSLSASMCLVRLHAQPHHLSRCVGISTEQWPNGSVVLLY